MSFLLHDLPVTIIAALWLAALACVVSARSFTETYGDFDARRAWEDKVFAAPAPPVSFLVDGKPSEELRWICGREKTRTLTDYAASGSPATRLVTEIGYTSPECGLLVSVRLTGYPGYPLTEYEAEIINISGRTSPRISAVKAFAGNIASFGKGTVHYNRGSAAFPPLPQEYQPLKAELDSDHPFCIEVDRGLPTAGYLPFVNLNGGKKGVIAALDWQGSWMILLRARKGIELLMGQRMTDLALLPGERLKVPGAVLLFYKGGDRQAGQNLWRRWIIEHNFLRNTGRRDFRENVFVCSDLTGYDKDMECIDNPLMDEIGRLYNATYEFDYAGAYGWFGMGNMTPGATGNWSIDEKYADGKLRALADRLREKNIGFCLWLEPERCYKGTEAAEALGEDNVIYTVATGELADPALGLVDYGKPAVQKYILRLLDSLVKEQAMTVYRQDYNIWNEPFWSARDKTEAERLGIPRTGMTENRAAAGYIATWTALEERNPGLVFDSCAGGGRRNDLSTLRFSFMHTKSDYWGPAISQQCQVFGALSWYVMVGTGFQDIASLYDVRSRPTLSIGVGAPDITEETMAALKEWKSLHTYMYKDFYQLTPYSLDREKNLAMEFNDYENREGMILAYLRMGGADRIYPLGLDPGAVYTFYDRDYRDRTLRRMTGREAMTKGVLVARGYEESAVVLEYKAEEGPAEPFDEAALLQFFGAEERPQARVIPADEQELAKAPALKGMEARYVMPDGISSGGIYAVGKELYDLLPFEEGSEEPDWSPLDVQRLGLYLDPQYGSLPLIFWSGGGFPMSAYAGRRGDRYFIWLRDSFGLGDPDGAWKNDTRRFVIFTPGGEDIRSDEFTFCSNEFGKEPAREIQFACYDTDKKGTVYLLSDRLFGELAGDGEGPVEKGIRWRSVKEGVTLMKEGDVTLWVGEKDGAKYLYAQNSMSLAMSERVRLYYHDRGRGIYTYTIFYLYGRQHRAGGGILPENVKL
ncbi:MAG: alpha-galactosidase [Abditibacteriota bacterium]|nr:alpha-galactosidase [Abditibacteriota bacterium]